MADLAESEPSVTPAPLPSTATATASQIDHKPETSNESQANGKASGEPLRQEAIDAAVTMRENNASSQQGSTGETRIPTKKDATLREFLSKMDEHAPIIPDAVINYYLVLGGLPPPPATPLPLARLLALATQKFIADVASDAYQYSRIRASTTSSSSTNMPGMPTQMPATTGAGDKTAVDKTDRGKNTNLGVQRPGFGSGTSGTTQGRTVLTMEDLGMAVGEYGINLRRGEFYR